MYSDGQPIPEPKHTNEGRYFENDNIIRIGLTFFGGVWGWGWGGCLYVCVYAFKLDIRLLHTYQMEFFSTKNIMFNIDPGAPLPTSGEAETTSGTTQASGPGSTSGASKQTFGTFHVHLALMNVALFVAFI